MASWSKKNVSDFIELYKSHECLWKLKCDAYRNRQLKDKAYEQLVRYVREFDVDVNRDYIVKKINSIRSSFRKELRKVERSEMLGCEEDVYKPKLWYFNLLLFLKDQEIPTSGIIENSTFHQEDFKTEFPETFSEPESPHSAASFGWTYSSTAATNQQVQIRHGKRRAPEDDNLDVVRNGVKYYIPDDDQYDIFGKNVAFKLRQMAQTQRIHAEKIISDVLYEGELGNLSRAAHLDTTV